MLTDARLRYLWCVFAGGILLLSLLPRGSQLYDTVTAVDSNRWIHFLAYLAMASVPIAFWRQRTGVLFSLAIAVLGFSSEFLRAMIPGLVERPQNALADLFGVAAGVLLGLNIRMMVGPKRLSSIRPGRSESKPIKWFQGPDASASEIEG